MSIAGRDENGGVFRSFATLADGLMRRSVRLLSAETEGAIVDADDDDEFTRRRWRVVLELQKSLERSDRQVWRSEPDSRIRFHARRQASFPILPARP